jgi:hypothetical protein
VAIGSRPGAEQGRDAERARADAMEAERDQALVVAREAVRAVEAEQARGGGLRRPRTALRRRCLGSGWRPAGPVWRPAGRWRPGAAQGRVVGE